jgi:hypothetical protein
MILQLRYTLLILIASSIVYSQEQSANKAAATPATKPVLNKDLDPKEAFGDISSLFEDVVAVQRKALKKTNSFLISPYFSFDFSDSPYTMYGLNLNLGYAPSEFFEIYLNVVPFYVTQERSLSKKVRELTLQNSEKAEIKTEKAKISYSAEALWSPAYGKDSWGLRGVIRSDTFFAFSVGMIKYETSTGLKTKVCVGKTFFIADEFNFRIQSGVSILESVTDGKKEMQNMGLLEAGTVYYF